MSVEPSSRVEWIEVRLHPEPDGSAVNAYAPTLPGAVSYGTDETEALANIAEAVEGCLAAYADLNKTPPWEGFAAPPAEGESVRWVRVRVPEAIPIG
jgi:predicted RNase H-like HicB family nuclease